MRSASLLPSTPAGLRGSERSTVLGCLGAVWGLGCLSWGVFWCGAVRPVVAVSFGGLVGWPGGRWSVWGRCLSKLLFKGIHIRFMFMLR